MLSIGLALSRFLLIDTFLNAVFILIHQIIEMAGRYGYSAAAEKSSPSYCDLKITA
jgi:hypothetical protein